ncbi:hypothetical protein SCUP234_12459 [Seiridium cupressi]
MPLFSRSSNKSAGTSASSSSTVSRIHTVDIDRPHQAYSGAPEDEDIPSFARTGSYYQTGATQQEYRYLEASDVRRQVREAPSIDRSVGGYPKTYHNQPPQPLRAQQPYKEYPIVPSPQGGSAPGNHRAGRRPGPVRAFYNDADRTKFDVGYHDANSAPAGPRDGREFMNTNYSLGKYYPAPTYTAVRRS